MKILVLEPSGNLWGSERALLDLLVHIDTAQLAVCCPPGTPLVEKLTAHAIPVFPYLGRDLHNKPRWRRLGSVAGLLRACVEFRPDVIYVNQAGVCRIALTVARILGLPVVSHVRIFEDAAHLAARHRPGGRLRGLIAISGAIRDELARFRSLDGVPVLTIYDAYAPSASPAPAPVADPPRVACVGRIVPIKGQDVFLRAAGQLFASGVHARFLIVGDGDAAYLRELRDLVPATAAVEWTGFQMDVVTLLQSCAVLVCPSHREPLGRVILEAWDAGALPVVYAGSGGAAEMVRAADGGIVYPEQTPESLAAAIAQALALSPADRARLVENGRAWMRAHCAPRRYAAEVAAFLALAPQAS